MIPFGFQVPFKEDCEDAPPIYTEHYSVICDGLGGAGSRGHTKYSNDGMTVETHTSAFIGARLVSACVASFLERNYETMRAAIIAEENSKESISEIILELKQEIHSELRHCMEIYKIPEKVVDERTFKVFPTTLAAAVYFKYGDETVVLAVWAGDSRIYILNPNQGLQLLSKDDSDMACEMDSASIMNNCIAADGDFILNYAVYRTIGSQVVLCCSDGCFDLMPSPLHFEWLLLYSALHCPSTSAFDAGEALSVSIKEKFYESPCDDTTMCGILIGINNTSDLKCLFEPRFEKLSPSAQRMNKAYNDWKFAEEKLQHMKKEQRLLAPEVEREMKKLIFDALKDGERNPFYRIIIAQPAVASLQLLTDEEYSQKLIEVNRLEAIVDVIYTGVRERLIETLIYLDSDLKELLPINLCRYVEICMAWNAEAARSSAAEKEEKRLWEEYRRKYQLFTRVRDRGAI